MIVELVAGAVALGVTASGWIAAFKARGESNAAGKRADEASERSRLSAARAEVAEAKASHAIADADAMRAELRAAETAREFAERTLAFERAEKRGLLEKLAAKGVPVGPDLVDATVDRLYANKDRRGPEGGDPNRDEGGRGRSVPDDAPTPPDGTAKARR